MHFAKGGGMQFAKLEPVILKPLNLAIIMYLE